MATKKLKMSDLKKIIKEELQGVMEAEPAAIDFGGQPPAAQPAAEKGPKFKVGDFVAWKEDVFAQIVEVDTSGRVPTYTIHQVRMEVAPVMEEGDYLRRATNTELRDARDIIDLK